MSFRDMVNEDNTSVFMNQDDFANTHTIEYDGETYKNVPCVISQLEEQDRVTKMRHHSQGMKYARRSGAQVIGISDGDFMREYYVAESGCDLGMIRLELEALDQ